jgi:HAMP domain-containing protein
MAALVAVQVLFGVAVLAGVLTKRLLRPIDRLKSQAGQLAAREPMPHHDWPRGDELGELGQHLNTVHAQIREPDHELEGKNEQLHRMAMFDHLTGLPNRTLLRELFARDGGAGAPQRHDRWRCCSSTSTTSRPSTTAYRPRRRRRTAAEHGAPHPRTLREADLVCRVSGDEFLALLSVPRRRPRCGWRPTAW